MIHLRRFTAISLVTTAVSFFGILNSTEGAPRSRQGNLQAQRSEPRETDPFLTRLKDEEMGGLYSGAVWTLIHDYSDLRRVEEVLASIQSYFESLQGYETEKDSSAQTSELVRSFKRKIASWLADSDQAVRAFAATMLGIGGDRTYAPQVAKLLEARGYNARRLRYDRGRAALALGLLGAREYARRLVPLLQSSNEYDRGGAAMGLGWMGAKEWAKAIAKLLNDRDESVRGAATESLTRMGATQLITASRPAQDKRRHKR